MKCRILVDETLFSLAEQNDNLLDRKLFVKQGIAMPQVSKTIWQHLTYMQKEYNFFKNLLCNCEVRSLIH